MADRPSPRPPFQSWCRGLAGLVIVVALLDLAIGWGLGLDVFVRIRPAYPAMVPGTATCLILGGLGVIFAGLSRLGLLGPACGCAIPVIVLVNYVIPLFDLGRDGMSLGTAAASLLVSAALLARLFGDSGGPLRVAIDTFGLSVVAIPLLGYLFNAEALFANPFYTKMALHTATGFALVFIALLLLDARSGWMAVLTAPHPGGQMLRRLFPVLIVGPVLLTGLALAASRRELLSPDLRAAVLTYLMILLTGSAATYFAHLANMADRRRAASEARRRESEAARQAAELALERAQRIEALGRLVGGVAHDFNNALAVILGNVQLLQSHPEDPERDSFMTAAVDAVEQAAALTGQLLAYGRKSHLSPEPVVIDQLVTGTLGMFERLCPANIAMTCRLSAAGALVTIDPTKFQQALLNILINARDAQPEGGAIDITSRVATQDETEVPGFGITERLSPGLFVLVDVTDRGPGMTAETLQRATDPFFTTKPVGEGTGLGLSVASGFCRQSGGALTLLSPEGKGLTVRMTFPVSRRAGLGVATAGPTGRPLPRAAKSILLVDDDPQVTRVMARQLRDDGHEVAIAGTADEALARIARGPVPDLVITDVTMPGKLQGRDLSRVLRQQHPGIRILLMSGYDSPRDRGEGTTEPFLQKPINWAVLREVVAQLLSQPQHR